MVLNYYFGQAPALRASAGGRVAADVQRASGEGGGPAEQVPRRGLRSRRVLRVRRLSLRKIFARCVCVASLRWRYIEMCVAIGFDFLFLLIFWLRGQFIEWRHTYDARRRDAEG